MDDSTNDVASTESRGPRGWVVLAVTAVIAALLVAAGVALNRWVIGDDDDEVADSVPTTEDDTIDVEPVSTSPTRLFSRETDGGVEIRVNESDEDWFGMPAPADDDRPGWCRPDSTVMVSALSQDAISQTQLPRTEEAPPDPAVMMAPGGMIEQAPLVLVVAQVGDDVTLARLSHAGGATDSMEPHEGLIALAIEIPLTEPADNNGGGPFDPFGMDMSAVAVEFLRSDGTSVRLTEQQLWNGIPMWNDPECNPGMFDPGTVEPEIPELDLPDPGPTQPADPVAERAAIEESFAQLYTNFDDDATLFRLIDDASGIDLILDDLLDGDNGDDIRTMKPVITDLVFFSPIEASFVYTTGLDIYDDGFSGRFPSFGRARLIDGVWRITRSTVCQDLSKAGWGCTI